MSFYHCAFQFIFFRNVHFLLNNHSQELYGPTGNGLAGHFGNSRYVDRTEALGPAPYATHSLGSASDTVVARMSRGLIDRRSESALH